MTNYNYYFNLENEEELTFNNNEELKEITNELENKYKDVTFEVRAWETKEDLEDGEYDVIYEGKSLKKAINIAMDEVNCDNVIHAEIFTEDDEFIFCAKYESNEELECY